MATIATALIVPTLALGFAALAAELQEQAVRARLAPADPVKLARFLSSRRAGT